jgi:hypothetical protein
MDVSSVFSPSSPPMNCSALQNYVFQSRLPLTTDWGHHTGTIDWCETNYSHSPYIAEFVNTLTNLPSILLGIYGAWHTTRNGIPLRYGLCYLGLSLIGVGSFGFHASLRWEWQLMDELPMVRLTLLKEKSMSLGTVLEKPSMSEGGALILDLPRHLCGLFDS